MNLKIKARALASGSYCINHLEMHLKEVKNIVIDDIINESLQSKKEEIMNIFRNKYIFEKVLENK